VPVAVQATVKPGEQIEPIAEWVEVYRERRERFRELYPALAPFQRSAGDNGDDRPAPD
jgi:sugar (pentulose or hexulose) kinase